MCNALQWMVAAFLILGSNPGVGSADQNVEIVLFPLEDRTEDMELAWLAEGLAHSLSRQVAEAGVTPLEREGIVRLARTLGLPGKLPLSRAAMIEIGRRAAAEYLVWGSYSGTAEDLRIQLRVLDLGSLKAGGDIAGNGPILALRHIENELSWLILDSVGLNRGLGRAEFAKIIRKIPNEPFALYIKSLALTDRMERAELLLEAVGMYAGFLEAHAELGRYFAGIERCGDALGHLDLVIQAKPAHLEALFLRGNCQLAEKKIPDSILSFTRLVSLRPHAGAFNNLGIAHLWAGNHSLALDYMRLAWDDNGRDHIISINLCIIGYLADNANVTLELLENALGFHPDVAMLHYLRSLVLSDIGRPEEAAGAREESGRLGLDLVSVGSQHPKSWLKVFRAFEHPEP